jgi:hypothetical protein
MHMQRRCDVCVVIATDFLSLLLPLLFVCTLQTSSYFCRDFLNGEEPRNVFRICLRLLSISDVMKYGQIYKNKQPNKKKVTLNKLADMHSSN